MFLLREIVKDLVGGVDLGVVVQMRVDVAGRSDITVAKPFLNILKGYPAASTAAPHQPSDGSSKMRKSFT